jgi:hypothetical protein
MNTQTTNTRKEEEAYQGETRTYRDIKIKTQRDNITPESDEPEEETYATVNRGTSTRDGTKDHSKRSRAQNNNKKSTQSTKQSRATQVSKARTKTYMERKLHTQSDRTQSVKQQA